MKKFAQDFCTKITTTIDEHWPWTIILAIAWILFGWPIYLLIILCELFDEDNFNGKT